ncbi:MAG: hypothetical protein NW214_11455 [Pseudanabaenaceae cyanobacterium bins.39]|nr:hypothetical protein [Pseudanabaenaceae cyanobacterium bins.39]
MPPCSPRCRQSPTIFYTAMDLQCGEDLRSILTNDDYAIAKSTYDNQKLRGQRFSLIRIGGASTGASPLRVKS